MPIYEYVYKACKKEFEAICLMSEKDSSHRVREAQQEKGQAEVINIQRPQRIRQRGRYFRRL